MKLTEVTSYNLKSQTILNESWDMLTESQRLHIGAWEKNVWPLMEQLNTLLEAELTADQIQQIFANAEKVSIEGGKNMTALGKGAKVTAEVSGKIKAEIEKLIKQAANSEPVKNMDQQFDKLRTELANKLKTMKGGDKILAGVDKWKQFATKNPGKSTFIIAAMTSLLAFASGGIMSGAAIGFFLRLANNTIKGDKLSTAVGKGIKTAALGAIAGGIGDALGDAVGDNIEVSQPEVEGGDATVSVEVSSDDVNSNLPDDTAQAVEQDPDAVVEELPLEDFKKSMAEKILQDRVDQFGGTVTPEMIDKVASNIEVNGDYPSSYTAGLDGTFVRGSIYLDPSEAEEYSRIVQANGGGMQGHFSEEANEFIKNAGGSGPNVVPDGGADPETGAGDDDLEKAMDQGTPKAPEGEPAAGSKPEGFDEMSPDEKVGELLYIDEKDWTPEDYELMKSQGELTADNLQGYYSANPEALAKALGGDLNKLEDFINSEANNFDDLSSTDREQIRGYLEQMAKKGGAGFGGNESIEDRLWDAFELYEQSLNEGPLGTAAKNFAKSVGGVAAAGAKAVGSGIAGAAKKGAAAVGKEVSQKITVRKLNKMWKDAGSPTDTGSIANILSQAGMNDEQIGLVSTNAKVDLKPTAGTSAPTGDAGASTSTSTVDIKSLADEIKKAGPEIVSAVKTMLTAKPTAKPVAKPKYAAPPAQPKAAPAATAV